MKDNHIHVCIMAGGAGTRFWPMSTEHTPKQFIDVLGVGHSLLQMTYNRALQITSPDNIWILTHEKYNQIVLDQLPSHPVGQIILEPLRKNTAPAIALAALKLHHRDPESIMVMLSSDHVILKEQTFAEDILTGVAHVEQHDSIVTLGIKPNRPHTGYGYIQFAESSDSLKPVYRFVEKPEEQLARQFVESGEYLWNAGIFIWSATRILRELNQHAKDIYNTFAQVTPYIDTAQETERIMQAFELTRSESIDFAVMEHLKDIYTKPSDIGWSDLGTWGALHELLDKDEDGNNVQQSSSIILEECKSSVVRIPINKKAIVKGLEGFVVAWEEEGLLIYPLEREQELKGSLGKLL